MRLPPAPPGLASTRDSLHRVAEAVLSARRVEATGNEIALTVRDGAVATPDLPGGGWVGIRDSELIHVSPAGDQTRGPLTTLQAAARAAGLNAWADLDDAPLAIDHDAAAFLTVAYTFAAEVLGALRDEASSEADPSPLRLWPEHFDIAYEEGDEAAGRRAGFGFSPGDEHHSEPYAYVGPWVAPEPGPLWTATGFTGAQLDWEQIAAAEDPGECVLAFWRSRREALVTAPGAAA